MQGLATQNGGNGFLATPATLADGVTAANAPHANLAEIGAIFNDAASRILGGVNADKQADHHRRHECGASPDSTI